MKKIIALFVAIMFLGLTAAPVFAGSPACDKFKGGIQQVVTSPLYLADGFKSGYEAAEKKPLGVLPGLLGGTLKGAYDGVLSFGEGAFDMLTFFITDKEETAGE